LKLVHLADLHFGAADPNVMAAAARQIRVFSPDAVIVSGDLTQSGRRREFDAAREWLLGLGTRIACTPGNHDTPMFQLHHRVMRPFSRYRDHVAEFSFPLDLGKVRVDGLNTARGWQVRRNWAEGSVDLDDLDQILSAESKAETRILACHHPFVSPAGAPLQTATRRGRRASARLGASDVNVLLNGHVHAPQVEIIPGPFGAYVSVTAGTLSLRLRQVPPSFNTLEFDGALMTVTAYSHDGYDFTRKIRSVWNTVRMEQLRPPRVVSA